ncbi:MAG: thioredoxin family protein [Rhodocyclales bacterium]|nr:thioredoxin family protein [Rhodocyclales bacterium]
MPPPTPPLSVICLCAEWCGTCREYRAGFQQIVARFPDAQFFWLDIEDHADDLGDLDIENFPTLLIGRGESILYYGVMLPYPEHLARILENFQAQTVEQSEHYARATPERQHWQEDRDLQRVLERWRNR